MHQYLLSIWNGLRRSWRDQRGQSLIELLIAGTVTLIILGAISTLLISSQRAQAKNVNYDEAQSGAQVSLDTMLGEIRDATNIVSWGPNFVDMDLNIGGAPYQVLYECDVPATNGWNRCVRLQTAVGATLPSLSAATTVIPYLSNGTVTAPVFTWSSERTAPVAPSTSTTTTVTTPTVSLAPDYVSATVDVPASDGVTVAALSLNRTIAFSAGSLIPNVDVEN